MINGALTVTGQTFDPHNSIVPWDNAGYGINYIYTWPPPQTEPTHCIGKAHVFECDHVEACQCGKVRRVMPKATPAKNAKR